MEQLTALGTGFAVATKCFTTCFTVSDGTEHFMIDTGGGSGVLTNMEKRGIRPEQVHHIFLSHCHTDHVMGAVWLIRMIGHGIARGQYTGDLTIYCEEKIAAGVRQMCEFMLPERILQLFGDRIRFCLIRDGYQAEILGRRTTFFDTGSHKTQQFGLAITLRGGRRLTYLGDEPYSSAAAPYAARADYLMHEAMCLEAEAERFHPHRISHSTVLDAARNAAALEAGALILHHTADNDLAHRKQAYIEEAKRCFAGPVFMPDDLDVIALS